VLNHIALWLLQIRCHKQMTGVRPVIATRRRSKREAQVSIETEYYDITPELDVLFAPVRGV
jgi:hypothetical protein